MSTPTTAGLSDKELRHDRFRMSGGRAGSVERGPFAGGGSEGAQQRQGAAAG